MKNLLYITDQEEYSEHGTISSMFHGYLKEYYNINVVYFTKYKHSFQAKDDDFIVPEHCNMDIISYLLSQNIDINKYQYIIVRNTGQILKSVLKYRQYYNYKVGFRTSFAKSTQAYKSAKLENAGVLKSVLIKYGNWKKDKLINHVDIFIPTSPQMKKVFYPQVNAKTFILPTAIDPKRVQNLPNRSDGTYRFIYVGTLDKLREFEVVLDAFNNLKRDDWKLSVIVYNPEVINELIKKYPKIKDKISIIDTDEISKMYEHISKSDIGLALFPNKSIYNNALASKVVDYYACSLPTLLSNNQKNCSVFEDEKEAFIVDFNSQDILRKIEKIMNIDESELLKIGENGFKKLIKEGRSYDKLSQELYDELEALG